MMKDILAKIMCAQAANLPNRVELEDGTAQNANTIFALIAEIKRLLLQYSFSTVNATILIL
jgi:hypothetical protein